MNKKKFFKLRLYFTAILTIAIWLLLIWDHFHGGVASHHLLQREDLPAFSNWWGGLLLPLLAWFLVFRIEKRVGNEALVSKHNITILYAFGSALLFGILLSLFFTLGYTEIPFYMMVGLFIVAMFFPIYRAECFLGFYIGMTYTFGGVLPIIILSIFSLIGALLYLIVRPVIRFLAVKLSHLLHLK